MRGNRCIVSTAFVGCDGRSSQMSPWQPLKGSAFAYDITDGAGELFVCKPRDDNFEEWGCLIIGRPFHPGSAGRNAHTKLVYAGRVCVQPPIVALAEKDR